MLSCCLKGTRLVGTEQEPAAKEMLPACPFCGMLTRSSGLTGLLWAALKTSTAATSTGGSASRCLPPGETSDLSLH
jgi:hypothetical protein